MTVIRHSRRLTRWAEPMFLYFDGNRKVYRTVITAGWAMTSEIRLMIRLFIVLTFTITLMEEIEKKLIEK